MTPSSSTSRLFSSRMMSADSLAMSTAVSTEMPTSAALSAGPSLMPSPRKPTTCPLRCSALITRAFCCGESLANTVARSAASASASSDIASSSLPSTHASDLQADVAAHLARDDLVVAGEDLHLHAVLAQHRDRRQRGFLGRVEEGDVARPGSGPTSSATSVRSAARRHLLVGHRDDAEAVLVELADDRAQLLEHAPAPSATDFARAARPCVQTLKISSTAPLQMSTWVRVVLLHHHRHAPALEVERDLVDLGVALARPASCVVHLAVLQHRHVEQVLQPRSGSSC